MNTLIKFCIFSHIIFSHLNPSFVTIIICRIHQLYDIKDIAKDVLALFYRVTHSVSHSEGIQETISEIKKESSEIIDEFQHTVAKAKAEYFDLTNSERKHLADAAAAAAASTAIEIEDNSSGQDESSFPSGAAAVTSPPPQSQAPSVFGTVAEHAEKLETSMKSQDSTNVFAESQDKRGASIETVVKLVEDDVSEEEEEEENNDSSPTSPPSAQHSDDNNVINGTIIASADGYKSFNGTDDEGSEGGDGDDEEEEESTPVSHQHKKQPNLDKMPVLIDSENNQYVMSKSNDITLIYEDSRLMNDLVVMLFISALLSYLMTLLRLP